MEGGYQKAVDQKVTGITTTGTKLQLLLERPLNNFMLQVYGEGDVPTAWDVRLKGGLDSDKVGTMVNHESTGDDDGDLKTVQGLPAKHIEIEVNGLTLGSATGITVVVIGMKQ